MKRVVVTGMGGLSPLGNDWPTVHAALAQYRNKVIYMPDWEIYRGLYTRLAAPVAAFQLPAHYDRKKIRSMGRVALMATRACELALESAGLLGHPLLTSGDLGIAYGSSAGSPNALADFARMLVDKNTEGITANTYVKMMCHTAPVNVGVFFGITGRIIPTSSACTSGSQGIGYAFETIRQGSQLAMLAGGAEELCPSEAAVFDTLFATSQRNTTPDTSPRPFDSDRDGLVLGEGAGALLLEELEHARARGAPIFAEIVGFGTNSDGTHITQPQASTMGQAMAIAMELAHLRPQDIAYVNAHGTGTKTGDIAESTATAATVGRVPISSLKSYMGHTLGACGALEAWMTIEMLRRAWFAPTLNLHQVDVACGDLDYIKGESRHIKATYAMSNNFAFGGINTSLIFKRFD